jgi:transposase
MVRRRLTSRWRAIRRSKVAVDRPSELFARRVNKKGRPRFTAEFKREAVRLLDAGERPASEVAIDLGIRRNQLYKWKAKQSRSGELSFPGSGRKHADQDSEIVRLKREPESNGTEDPRVRSCFATLPGVACLHVSPSSH